MRSIKGCRILIGLICCLLAPACGSKAANQENAEIGETGSLSLDLENPSLFYPIDPGIEDSEKLKFVQIEIGELFNPRLLRIIFEVRHRAETGEETLLGTFAPFPPDNPGTYIVSTGERLEAGGAILLSLVVLDEIGSEDQLRVVLESISFREK